VLDGAFRYGCASYREGNACSNDARVRRDHAEHVLLDPIRQDLLAPERVARMAKEMQEYYVEQSRALRARAIEAPKELEQITARIERLRERLRQGDPDMPPDELQAAIERAEQRRRELGEATVGVLASAKILSLLPRAANLYREQIAAGLDGDPKAALSARTLLRELFSGEIRLVPEAGGGLVAHWKLDTGALMRAAVVLSDTSVTVKSQN
jgi:hypothetical protein